MVIVPGKEEESAILIPIVNGNVLLLRNVLLREDMMLRIEDAPIGCYLSLFCQTKSVSKYIGVSNVKQQVQGNTFMSS